MVEILNIAAGYNRDLMAVAQNLKRAECQAHACKSHMTQRLVAPIKVRNLPLAIIGNQGRFITFATGEKINKFINSYNSKALKVRIYSL